MACASDPPESSTALERAFSHHLRDDAADLASQADAGVVVALFDLDHWQPFLAQAATLADAAESARAARQRLPANRDALVLAYALHRLLLSRILCCAPAEVMLRRDAKGCPRLPGDRLYTSLSHAGRRVAIAAAASGPVGVDIEPGHRAPEMPELAGRIAHPDEMRHLDALPAAALGQALLALWVRKEAFLKAAGIGLEREMDTFPAPEGVALPLPGETFPGRWAELRAVDGTGAWAMAVAIPPRAPVLLVDGVHADRARVSGLRSGGNA